LGLFFGFSSVFSKTLGSEIVNQIRKKAKMAPLDYNLALSKAAYNHAKYLARLRLRSHFESPKYPYFSGKTPFDRMINAGFGSRVGVENISFGEKSYSKSIENLFATIYHRLAFLDFRIDCIGTSAYGNKRGKVYVYEMSALEISKLCRKKAHSKSKEFVFGICKDKNKKISLKDFQRAIKKINKKSAKIIFFPYPNAKVKREFVNETPKPFKKNVKYGFPISVQLNPAYYSWAKVLSFKVFDSKKRELKSIFLDSKRDFHHKIPKLTFILVPKKILNSKERYYVEFVASTNNGKIRKNWSFSTK
jgi:hypothetical protein